MLKIQKTNTELPKNDRKKKGPEVQVVDDFSSAEEDRRRLLSKTPKFQSHRNLDKYKDVPEFQDGRG